MGRARVLREAEGHRSGGGRLRDLGHDFKRSLTLSGARRDTIVTSVEPGDRLVLCSHSVWQHGDLLERLGAARLTGAELKMLLPEGAPRWAEFRVGDRRNAHALRASVVNETMNCT